MVMTEDTVTTTPVLFEEQFGAQLPPWPGSQAAPKRNPKPNSGTDCQEEKWVKGLGTGLFVIQNSGQAACIPAESSETSKVTFPVLPAKSNGCLGYIVKAVTSPLAFSAVSGSKGSRV